MEDVVQSMDLLGVKSDDKIETLDAGTDGSDENAGIKMDAQYTAFVGQRNSGECEGPLLLRKGSSCRWRTTAWSRFFCRCCLFLHWCRSHLEARSNCTCWCRFLLLFLFLAKHVVEEDTLATDKTEMETLCQLLILRSHLEWLILEHLVTSVQSIDILLCEQGIDPEKFKGVKWYIQISEDGKLRD
ncbi:hypothetical protein HG530_001429 [Fusarium avenaceum]|nr:hypothetical protein HG530_001429 [Fusarium avenaceum]